MALTRRDRGVVHGKDHLMDDTPVLPPPPPESGIGSDAPEDQPVSSSIHRIFGFINIIFGGLILVLMAGFFVWGLVMKGAPAGDGNSEAAAIQEVMARFQALPSVRVVGVVTLALSVGLNSLLVWSGFLLLRKSEWGRSLSLVYAVASLLLGAFAVLLWQSYLKGNLTEMISSGDLPEDRQSFLIKIVGIQTILSNVCCYAVYPVVLLIYMLPEKFRRHLASGKKAVD